MVPPESSQPGLLEKVLAEYMDRLDRGEAVDRDQILTQHPELAEDLRSYFAGGDEVERLGWAGAGQTTTPTPRLPRARPAAAETTPAEPVRASVGDYDLLEQIGQGGMGIIYKARQRSLRRLVALKMIRTDRLASFADRLRFHSEAEAVASLDHPHIVPIYEVGVHEGQPFFSMKLVEGGSLAQQLPRFAADPRAGTGLLATVARAVHYAHQRGLLHRDLKPGNILLDAEGGPHVTDFGLAKRLGPQRGEASITQQGAIVGTPNYMAPEQATNRGGVSTATDVYSLGAILYEMLTGRPPFSAETPLDTLRQLVEQNPLPPRSLNRRVDRDLETICLKCLQKEPHQRYRSAEALADDLERWLRGKPIRARPVSRPERALKWARRQPHLAALGTLLVLALLAGFVGVWCWQWQRAEAENRRAAELAEAERQAHYARAIPLAYARWLAGNAGAAEQVLAETDAGLRGWEWHYLRRLFITRQLATLQGHKAGVLAVVFSPDGWRVASGDALGVVKVWDRRTLKAVLTLPGHTDAVASMAFSADGTYLASGSADGSVRVWDAATGEALAAFEAHAGGVTGLAFDPTPPDAAGQPAGKGRPARRLVSTGSQPPLGELKCWDAASGKFLGGRTHDYPFTAMAYSPDGKQLVTAGPKGDVTGRDAATLAPVRTYLIYKGLAEQQIFPLSNSVAFSADGNWVAAGSLTGLVRAWNAATTEECFSTLTSTGAGVSGLAFAGQDGRILTAATTDNTIQGWYTKGRKHAFTLRGHTRPVQAVACSPDGQCLASGSLDRTVKLWDLSQRDDDLTLRFSNQGVTSLAFTPDGTRLAAATPDQSLRIWDVATGKAALILKNLPEAVNGLAFSPDGARLACAGANGTVQLLDPATGEKVAALRGHTGPAQAVAFRPDGATLASAGVDGSVRLWEVASGREILCLQGAAAVRAVAFNHDGSRLAVADADGIARVWETDTGQEALALRDHDGPVHAVAFSPDGRHLATAGKDEAVRIWDATTGKLLRILHGHGGAVRGLAYGPGGRLASVGDDRAVRVWDAEGHELLALWGHTGVLRAVAFSGNGHLLASAGEDGTVKVWDGTPLKGS